MSLAPVLHASPARQGGRTDRARAVRALVAAAALAAIMLAGCTGEPSDGTSLTPGIIVDTDPYQNRTVDTGSQPHLHDYWGGAHTLTVLDETATPQGLTWYAPTYANVSSMRPGDGKVVPLGAGYANVTVSWTDDQGAVPPNQYADVQLWVKTARDAEPTLRATLPLASAAGSTTTLRLNLSDDDLPHQVLSAWQVDVRMVGTPDPVFGHALYFSGSVHVVLTVDRTLEIPLFPGHPDKWKGATDIALLSGAAHLFYTGDPTSGSWACINGCPIVHHPDSGVTVPTDTTSITVELTVTTPSPAKLGLKFHGADHREFRVASISIDGGAKRTYELVVGDGGDGPYAAQSQWEFAPYPEFPAENGWTYQDYTITAVAHR